MKFGKNPSNQIEETLPEWRDKFLSYKDLKRRLKLFSVAERPAKRSKVVDEGAAGDNAPSSTAVEEEEFVSLLEAELDKFNTFFVEKEEEYIIRQKDLQDRVTEAISRDSKEELMKVRKEIVDFHGEMVLLENYSALNYTGRALVLWMMKRNNDFSASSVPFSNALHLMFPTKMIVKVIIRFFMMLLFEEELMIWCKTVLVSF
ncbi:SPX domain-containing protein 1-like [Curcuma longa]|uniref:SPX domain-containing protein 1-like n=1 Tax=Curcuma longa TaxID=136217 RepID=UPI003D9DBA44